MTRSNRRASRKEDIGVEQEVRYIEHRYSRTVHMHLARPRLPTRDRPILNSMLRTVRISTRTTKSTWTQNEIRVTGPIARRLTVGTNHFEITVIVYTFTFSESATEAKEKAEILPFEIVEKCESAIITNNCIRSPKWWVKNRISRTNNIFIVLKPGTRKMRGVFFYKVFVYVNVKNVCLCAVYKRPTAHYNSQCSKYSKKWGEVNILWG
jgi:hypothetical protein